MGTRLVKVPGKVHGVVVERLPVVEHLADEIIDFVAGQVGFVVEVVVFLGFETSGEIGGQDLHQARVADLPGQCGGDEQGLVLGLIPDDMHGQRRDPGIFRIYHGCERLFVKRRAKGGKIFSPGQGIRPLFPVAGSLHSR